jgi:anthranilate phosphoribosyltransferase
MLGPLTNPAGANCQVLGVYAPELTEMFAQALRLLGARRTLVVHGHDGLDEISVCAPTRVSELKDGAIRTYDLTPQQLLGRQARREDIEGGDPAVNAEITRSIFNGEKGPRRDVVVVNAAAALIAAGIAEDFSRGIQLAESSIDQKKALGKLDALIRFTNANA